MASNPLLLFHFVKFLSPIYLPIQMQVRFDSHVDKTYSEYEEVGAIVDGVGNECSLNLSHHCEVPGVGIGLHHGQNDPGETRRTL